MDADSRLSQWHVLRMPLCACLFALRLTTHGRLGVLREYSASDGPPVRESDLVFPGDACRPHNWPALSAVETGWVYVQKFTSLEWIAICGDTELGVVEPDSAEVSRLNSTPDSLAEGAIHIHSCGEHIG